MFYTPKFQIGDRAPDFTLPDQDGKPVQLSDLLRNGPVVLYFYPKDETPGCTAQSCSFRDRYQSFTDAGAQVVGISADSEQSHRDFAAHHRLPFTLLSDRGDKVHEQYGVESAFGILRGRVTFVIDRGGVVQMVYASKLRPTAHVDEALEVVRKLAAA